MTRLDQFATRGPPAPRVASIRRVARSSGVLALIAAAGLLLAEATLRAGGWTFRFPTPCTWTPGVGCVLDANVSEPFFVGGEGGVVSTNAEGRRDRARMPKGPGAKRIVVLGDSVAFGARVGDGDTFCAVLEHLVADPSIEVVNAASLYLKGTEQQLAYFVDHASELAADVVVLAFTAKNDVSDNSRQEFWKQEASGLVRGTWVPPLRHRLVMASAHTPVVRWLNDHSSVFGAFEFFVWNIIDRPPAPPVEAGDQITQRVIERLRDETTRHGARLVLLLVPATEVVVAHRLHQAVDPTRPEALIARVAHDLALPLVDLTDVLATAEPALPLQFNDGHLTPAGHALTARTLAVRVPEWLSPRVAN